MKSLLAMCMIVATASVWAGENPASIKPASATASVKGEVLEVKSASSFTYLRLKTRDGEVWAAVVNASIKKGATVTIENFSVMENFHSKELKKTFSKILLGTVGGAGGSAPAPHGTDAHVQDTHAQDTHVLGAAYPIMGKKREAKEDDDMQVPKATGADARTVAEINLQSAELKDKTVRVRGRVVKYNAGIMGKNWVHLRDGSGSAAANTNDILVTTAGEAKLGDVLTAKGIIRTDKDFGAGYSYKVLIEEATLQ